MDAPGHRGEGSSRVSFSHADSPGVGGRKAGRYPLRRSPQFHACGGGLSVTSAAQASDNSKAKTADTQFRLSAAVKPQNVSYGVISQTTPTPYAPPHSVVP